MDALNGRGIDGAVSGSKWWFSSLQLKRATAAAAATLALAGGEVAEAGIVILPTGVDSIALSGNFYWPTRTGWESTYELGDMYGNIYSGNGMLAVPFEWGLYDLTLEAMRDTGERFNLIMRFGDLHFLDSQSFQASGTSLSSGNNNLSVGSSYAIGQWDSLWRGDVTTSFTNAQIASSVPEPGTLALMVAGLGAVGVVARRRRSSAGTSQSTPATWTTQQPETPEDTAA